jgi:hypothetical protein
MGKQARRAWRKQHDKITHERQQAGREDRERRLKGFRPATPGEMLALTQQRAPRRG